MKTTRHFAWGLALVACGALQIATAAPPATRLVSAPLVTPTAAWTFYGTATTHTNGTGAWSTTPPEIAALARTLGSDRVSSTTPQPAGTLSPDQYAQNVFDYVRNNIETEFRFGLGKGARGALIDQSGTSFDQAELMVKLLRAGGVTAGFRVGTITLNETQFGAWTGLVTDLNEGLQSFNVNATVACQFLADGGIPATCSETAGNLTVVLGHAWVAANSKLYDPAFKRNRLEFGVDVPAAMGCGSMTAPTCGEAIRAALMSGTGVTQGTFAGAPYIDNANRLGLSNQLRIYALNLENSIKNNSPGAELVDIVGGIERDLTYSPTPAASLPYTATAQYSWSGEIPNQFRTTLRMRGGGFDSTFHADEIAGRQVRLMGWEELFVDDQRFTAPQTFPPTLCPTCIADTVIIDIAHPYAASSGSYADAHTEYLLVEWESQGSSNRGTPPVTLVHGWGNGSAATERYVSDRQTAVPYVGSFSQCGGLVGGAPPPGGGGGGNGWIDMTDCENTLQPTIAAKLINQGASADRIVQGITRANLTRHHNVGIVYGRVWGPTSLSYLSVGSALSSNSRTNDPVARTAAFEGASAMWAMLEGSIYQQLGDLDRAVGVSADFWVRGGRLLDVSPSNMSAVLAALPNVSVSDWPDDRRARLQQAAGLGFSTIMSQVPGWGSIFYSSGASAYALLEAAKGGAPVGNFDPAAIALQTVNETPPSWFQANQSSVSVANGELTLTAAPDLVTGTGTFPNALEFKRSYRSGSPVTERIRGQSVDHYWPGDPDPNPPVYSAAYEYSGADSDYSARIGGGWTHNFEVLARYGNNGSSALGADSGLDAASVIAGVYALTDAARTAAFSNRLATMFASAWVGDRLMYNHVTVSAGANSESFHRLADNSFNAPPGSNARLLQTGEVVQNSRDYTAVTLRYIRGNGDEIAFNWAQKIGSKADPIFNATNWTFPDGVIITFGYANYGQSYHPPGQPNVNVFQYREILSTVSNNLGRRITFNSTPQFVPAGTGAVIWSIPVFKLNSITDESGRTVNFNLTGCTISTFFACSTLTVTSPAGAVSKYEYAANAASPDPAILLRPNYQLRRWYAPSNQSSPFRTVLFDELFRVQRITDVMGRVTNYYPGSIVGSELWKRGEVINTISQLNTKVSNVATFDDNGNEIVRTDALNRTTRSEYDDQNRLTRTTNPEGDELIRTYDVRSNLLTVVRRAKPGSGLADVPFETNTYVEGPAVRVCTTQKTCNLVASVTNALGQTTSFEYSSTTGQKLTATSPTVPMLAPNGTPGTGIPKTTWCYTSMTPTGSTAISFLTGKIERVNTTVNRVTSYGYNPSNKFVLASSTLDPTTTLTPPAAGVLSCPTSTKSGALNLATTFTHDAVGNVLSVNGPRTDVTDVTNYRFDSVRRLTRIDAPLSSITRFTYDLDGQRRTTRRAIVATPTDGNPANPAPADLVASHWNTETRDYWPSGTLRSTQDPRGDLTQFTYDDLDRQTMTTDPANRRVGTVYDGAGQVSCTWKGWNSSTPPTTCTWDPATYVSQGSDGPMRYVVSTYSLNGKQNRVQDADNNITDFVYDGFDRLAFTLFPHPTSGARCTVAAPVTNASTPSCPGGTQQTYEKTTYDAAGSRLSFRTRKNETTTWTYDALSRIRTKAAPGLATVTFDYNLANQPMLVSSPLSGSIPAHSVAYDYDGAGRKSFEENLLNGTAPARRVSFQYTQAGSRQRVTWPDGYFVHYSYDALNRMEFARENSTTANELARYQYDQLSRRRELRFAGQTNNRIDYTYETDSNLDVLTNVLSTVNVSLDHGRNAAGQINGIVASDQFYLPAPATAGTTAYSPNRLNLYSSIGSDPAPTYDLDGNLLTWGPTAARHTYTYDAEDRLRTVSITGGSSSSYDYDALGRRISKTVGSTSTFFLLDGDEEIAEYSSAGTVLRRFIMGPAVDDRIATAEGSAVSSPAKTYFRVNHQGSVIATTDSSGSATCTGCQRMSYDEYGNLGAGSVTTGQPYRYTGRRFDAESGLYYYRARYYAPSIGRFLQADPAGYKDDFNLYAYVGNDPANRTDPSGLCEYCNDEQLRANAEVMMFLLGKLGELMAKKVGDPYPVMLPSCGIPGGCGPSGIVVEEQQTVGSLVNIATLPFIAAKPFQLAAGIGEVTTTVRGTATVIQTINSAGGRHASILVRAGDATLHTEQVVVTDLVTTVRVAEAAPVVKSVTLELPDAAAAMRFQESLIGKVLPPYKPLTNSCLTHCGDVLRAGGLEAPAGTRALERWLSPLKPDP